MLTSFLHPNIRRGRGRPGNEAVSEVVEYVDLEIVYTVEPPNVETDIRTLFIRLDLSHCS